MATADAALVLALVIAGAAIRLYGLRSSFWLDEFGTLWAISGSLTELFDRVDSFHPQSALYYLIAWLPARVFGLSEVVVRGVSLASWALFCLLLPATTALIGGRRTVLPAVLVASFSAPLVVYAANARPYMLSMALLMAALWFLSRATILGARLSGPLFGVFGGLTFLAHYLVGLALPGIVGILLFNRSARIKYPLRSVLRDLLIMCVVSSVAAPHFLSVMRRGDQLNWLDAPETLLSAGIFLPLLPATILAVSGGRASLEKHALYLAAAATPLVVAIAATAVGVNLLFPRYLLGSLPAFCVIAAAGLSQRGVPAAIALVTFAVLNGASFHYLWKWTDTFTGINAQDWRGAQHILLREQQITPQAVVLYRSGLVEQDIPPLGSMRGPDRMPLQSPGLPAVSLRVLALTYRWNAEGREAYFSTLRASALSGPRAFVVSPIDARAKDYENRVIAWLQGGSHTALHLQRVAVRGVSVVILTPRPR